MSLTVNLYYTGTNGSARAFAGEMEKSGLATAVRAEATKKGSAPVSSLAFSNKMVAGH